MYYVLNVLNNVFKKERQYQSSSFMKFNLSSFVWYCCHTTEMAEVNKMDDFVLEDMLFNNHTIYS